MLYLDLAGYLPDNNLVKVDRASMAVGLEIRSPLLDHRVVELALRMPLAHRLGRDRGKLVLAKVLERHVPRELFDRPKRGFGLPIGQWLRGPLRDWAEDLLAASRLRQEGMLDPARVRGVWEAHRDGRRDAPELLWHLLMFQAWQARWGGANPSP
jgi:asparagine synthase (glutamine-hydrolysing)